MCICKFGTGLKACHCAACHRTFTSVEAFDRHRQGDYDARSCLDPSLMRRQDGQPLYELHAGRFRVARPFRAPHPAMAARGE
jgi:hypothetical protein